MTNVTEEEKKRRVHIRLSDQEVEFIDSVLEKGLADNKSALIKLLMSPYIAASKSYGANLILAVVNLLMTNPMEVVVWVAFKRQIMSMSETDRQVLSGIAALSVKELAEDGSVDAQWLKDEFLKTFSLWEGLNDVIGSPSPSPFNFGAYIEKPDEKESLMSANIRQYRNAVQRSTVCDAAEGIHGLILLAKMLERGGVSIPPPLKNLADSIDYDDTESSDPDEVSQAFDDFTLLVPELETTKGDDTFIKWLKEYFMDDLGILAEAKETSEDKEPVVEG